MIFGTGYRKSRKGADVANDKAGIGHNRGPALDEDEVISEAASKKRRRGRPRVLEYMDGTPEGRVFRAMIEHNGPRSARTHTNWHYMTEGLRVIREEGAEATLPRFAWESRPRSQRGAPKRAH